MNRPSNIIALYPDSALPSMHIVIPKYDPARCHPEAQTLTLFSWTFTLYRLSDRYVLAMFRGNGQERLWRINRKRNPKTIDLRTLAIALTRLANVLVSKLSHPLRAAACTLSFSTVHSGPELDSRPISPKP